MTTAYDEHAREIIRRLADLEPGLATSVQIGWEVGGSDVGERRAVRQVLTMLARTGVLHRQYVRHRDEPFEVVDVQRAPLLELLEESA